jgi:HK97 family phage major capsid protein
MKRSDEIRAKIAELTKRREALFAELENLRNRSDADSDGVAERIGNTNRAVVKIDDEIRDAEAQYGQLARLERWHEDPASEPGIFAIPGDGNVPVDPTPTRSTDQSPAGQARDAALRAIERAQLPSTAGDRLEGLIRRDRVGLDAEYVAAVADPVFGEGFGRMLTDPNASFTLSERERAAIVRVNRAMAARDITLAGTGSLGVPLALDPTLVAIGDGALCPLRQLATVSTIVGASEWRGVNTTDIAASFDAEGTEVGDDTPTLTQPAIPVEMARAFVPFSIETGQDWGGLQADLAVALADAKAVLEADKFVNGAGHGSHEPEGLIAGLAVGSQVETAGIGSLAVDDLYTVKEALPARFQPRAAWLGSGTIFDDAKRLVASADPDEPQVWQSGNPPRLLEKPAWEASEMSATVSAGEQILLYGDIAACFRIVDRVGLSIELVQHLVGPNHRPTGMRGIFAYWRVGAGVRADNAARLLVVKAS